MGSAQSAPAPVDQEKLSTAMMIISSILGGITILTIVILGAKYGYQNVGSIKTAAVGLGSIKTAAVGLGSIKTAAVGSTKWISGTGNSTVPWHIITPIILTILMVYYFSIAFWYRYTRGQWRSQIDSVNALLSIRRATLSTSIGPLTQISDSVSSSLLANPRIRPYNLINKSSEGQGDQRALVNWRPLTVRLAGYLGGINGPLDGVFDMAHGIQMAFHQGARAFVFDIDYLEVAPCQPIIAFRDNTGVMRSLNTGSIRDGCQAIATYAWSNNNFDPVIIIVYLRRIPMGDIQQKNFFGQIAASLSPLSEYHLGQTSQGNFHNCRSESVLFTTPITDYQKKFIVLCNYNTNVMPSTQNPKDNLDFWTNARIYQDPNGKSSALGSVTAAVPTGQVAYAQVGAREQLAVIGEKEQPAIQTTTIAKFSICLGQPDYTYTTAELAKLLNTLGIQCVPLDVLALATTKEHIDTLRLKNTPGSNLASLTTLDSLANAANEKDPLSFWTYAGWSWKLLIPAKQGFQDYKEGFEDAAPVPPAAPIPGFVIPKPVVPKKPAASLNSNGGMVNIS